MPAIRPDIVRHILKEQGLKKYNITDQGLNGANFVYSEKHNPPLYINRDQLEDIISCNKKTIDVTEIQRITIAYRLGIKNPDDLENLEIDVRKVSFYRISQIDYRTRPETYKKKNTDFDKYFIETRDGWKLSLLDKEKHSELLDHMHNNGNVWHCYHETILPNGQLGVIRSRLEIDKIGVCTFHHGRLKFPYKGTLFKDENLVLFADTPKNGSINERIIYRYLYIPDSEQMYGTWYGLNFPRNHFAGRAIISTNPNISDQEFLDDKNHLEIKLSLQDSKKKETTDCISWKKKWNTILLEDSMERLSIDEYVFFCSSFIPNAMRIKRAISDKALELSKSNPTRKFRVRMLFINPDAKQLVKARFRIRGETRHYINEIKGQVNDFLELAKTVSNYIDLDVRLYESWPFSHYFQFGYDAIYYALTRISHEWTRCSDLI